MTRAITLFCTLALALSATVPVAAQAALFSGSTGSDRLVGTASGDKMYGRDGADRLYGLGGRDRLVGGHGADRLYGGAGNDLIFAGTASGYSDSARDVISCGPGYDTVYVDPNDTVAADCEGAVANNQPGVTSAAPSAAPGT